MNKLLIEQINKIHSIMGIQVDLILEASKLNILIDKEGLSEEQAKILDELCGPLSLWMFDKFKEYQKTILKSWDKEISDKKIIIATINDNNLIGGNRQIIQGIMDWIRVGLNGNVKPFKNLPLMELKSKSQEWHDSLNIGSGDINYFEKNDIIKDFRDENGNGFYWVDLDTQDSPEECKRMGHCGRSSYGYLYSLREDKQINEKFKLNKSHLTASIGDDGTLYQLKGPKNSKPKDEYHQYILPLFYVLGGGGEEDDYLIRGFGTEYASQQDFRLSDLPESIIRELYNHRPELFKGRGIQRKLINMGLMEESNIDYNITLKLKPYEIGDLIDGDYVIHRRKLKKTTPAGTTYDSIIEVKLFETILSGDAYGLWEHYDNSDWKLAMEYNVDSKNEEKIKDILKKVVMKNENFDEEEFDNIDLIDLIEDFDDEHYIRGAINYAVNSAEQDEYVNHLYNTLKDCLQEYGTIEKMDDEGVILHIDTSNYLNDLNDTEFDEYMENCNDDIECVFYELNANNRFERPNFDIDDRWYPSIDDDYFNQLLSDNLVEAEGYYGLD